MNNDALVHRLEAEAAIRAVLGRYARSIDRLDFELLRSCYHPGAHDDHGVYSGPAEGFVEYLRGSLSRNIATMHLLGLPGIEVAGDVAWVETYGLALRRLPADGDLPLRDVETAVRYCDRMELHNGEWRIADRVVVFEYGRVDAVAVEPRSSPGHRRGVRSRDDPAYAR